VYQNVTHAGDVVPRNLGVLLLIFGRDGSCGFADDLEVINDPVSDQLVVLKALFAF
jgi:hypothetical protein